MIRFQGVRKAFGEKVVLDGLSLDIPEGATTALIGFSGSGKSVLLKHVVGLLTPDAGSVTVDDQVVHELDWDGLTALRSKIGYVFQFAALFDSMTIGDNLRLGLARRGLDAGEVEERVTQSLRVVDLAGTADHFPSELSGGMRKRVGVARAIALRPRYILYDEPTTGLDPVTSAVIDQLMIRVREEYGTTAIMVTHDMRSAYTVGDRIAMLYDGRILQVGTVQEIQQTEDPVVRQFIEGRPDLQGSRDATAMSAGGV